MNKYAKGANKMNISEFARDRGLKPTTVSLYIRRHPDEFNGHTRPSGNGNSLELDDIALELLDKKYPRKEQPVQILEHDPELERKIQEQNEVIRQLQAKIIALSEANSQLEHALGDAKQAQLMLANAEQQRDEAKTQLREAEKRYITEQAAANEERNRADVLETKLNYELQRAEAAKASIKEKEEQLSEAEKRAENAEAEANSYVRSWFGFFRQKKR